MEYDPAQVTYQHCWTSFGKSRSNDRESPGAGHGHAVPLGHLLPLARTKHRGEASKAGGDQRPGLASHCHRDGSAAAFWKAEDYHQQYLENRGLSSCYLQSGNGTAIALPKILAIYAGSTILGGEDGCNFQDGGHLQW